jgi:hypothetical protein
MTLIEGSFGQASQNHHFKRGPQDGKMTATSFSPPDSSHFAPQSPTLTSWLGKIFATLSPCWN